MTVRKLDGDGNVIGTEISPNMWTIQYSRKMGRENYGNEECGLFGQIATEDGDTWEQIQAKLDAAFAFAKTAVHQQLGITTIVTDDGIVRDEAQPQQAPKPAAARRRPKAAPTTQADRNALWDEWIADPTAWWDNRDNKRNPKAPDFKHKETGQGLWVDKAPASALLVLNGEATAEEPF